MVKKPHMPSHHSVVRSSIVHMYRVDI